jgi:hypothetical protein
VNVALVWRDSMLYPHRGGAVLIGLLSSLRFPKRGFFFVDWTPGSIEWIVAVAPKARGGFCVQIFENAVLEHSH